MIGPSPKDKTSQDIQTYFDNVATENVKLVLSHPDRDHINKIPMLFMDRLPESIWLGGKYGDYRGKVADFLDRAANAGIPISHGWPAGFANRGHPVSGLQCGTANAYVLTVNTEGSKNAQSFVLLLDYGEFRAIFSGDAEEETEEAAIKAYGALIKDTSVLLASHHGANTEGSNHDAWIEATNPQVVVFSSGTLYGHPREPVVERYQDIHEPSVASHLIWWGIGNAHQEPVETQFPHYVTEQNGTITIRTDGTDFTVECSAQSGCY